MYNPIQLSLIYLQMLVSWLGCRPNVSTMAFERRTISLSAVEPAASEPSVGYTAPVDGGQTRKQQSAASRREQQGVKSAKCKAVCLVFNLDLTCKIPAGTAVQGMGAHKH